MKCLNCGAEIQQNSKFCSYCGTETNLTKTNNNDGGFSLPVAIFKDKYNEYFGYDILSGEDTDSYSSKTKCINILKKQIEKYIAEECILPEDFPTESEVLSDKYTQKIATKGKIQPEIVYIEIGKSIIDKNLTESDEDDSDEDNDEDE